MKILPARMEYDPDYEKHMSDLTNLVTLAGSPKRLSKLLGVKLSSVYSWGRGGRISIMGAILVQKSKELGAHFTAVYLRPELNDKEIRNIAKSKEFKRYRRNQLTFEKNPNYKKGSPLEAMEKTQNEF